MKKTLSLACLFALALLALPGLTGSETLSELIRVEGRIPLRCGTA